MAAKKKASKKKKPAAKAVAKKKPVAKSAAKGKVRPKGKTAAKRKSATARKPAKRKSATNAVKSKGSATAASVEQPTASDQEIDALLDSALQESDGGDVAGGGDGQDRYRPVADALVRELEAAAGDEAKEAAALQKAIDGYLQIAGAGEPAELGLAEYFAEDGSVANPPALERVKGATDDDIFRWREKLADLAGY